MCGGHGVDWWIVCVGVTSGVDGGVPLYLFIGPGRGLVAGPGMADLPCHR